MSLAEEIPLTRIKIGIEAKTKPEIIRELVQVLADEGVIRDVDGAVEEFLEREAKGSTGIGNGIAIPHVRSSQVDRLEYVFANSREGVDFQSLDGEPVHIIVMMMAPKSSHGTHIKALATISRILNDQTVRLRLANAETPEEVQQILAEREREIA